MPYAVDGRAIVEGCVLKASVLNWNLNDAERICKNPECRKKQNQIWSCKRCNKKLPVAMFSQWLKGRKVQKNDGKAWCNDCKDMARQEEERVAEKTYNQTQHAKKA